MTKARAESIMNQSIIQVLILSAVIRCYHPYFVDEAP